MNQNSLIIYSKVLESLSKRQLEVLRCLKDLGVANNQMILLEMRKNYPTMQICSITGRTGELFEKNIILLDHSGECPINHGITDFYRCEDWIKML
jgi:hypothetical protein